MHHMAQFVFDFYRQKLQQLATQQAWPSVPSVQTWQPGSAGHESVRQQGRYDQSRTEEHPGAAGESDEEDEEVLPRPAAAAEAGNSEMTTEDKTSSDMTATDVTVTDKDSEASETMET